MFIDMVTSSGIKWKKFNASLTYTDYLCEQQNVCV
jgi:hypothetical protein